jgi:hypothetical protein
MGDSEGIARNIFNIIDAVYYKGKDAVISPNSDARGGEFSKVFGPNKVILDTGWSPMNAFVGLHQILMRWYTDSQSEDNHIIVEYHWRDKDGNKGNHSVTRSFQGDISDEVGNGVGKAYFHENYQYRFVVKSHPSIRENEYVAVDYLKIIVNNIFSVDDMFYGGETPAIPYDVSGYTTLTGDASNWYFTKTITLDFTPFTFSPFVMLGTTNVLMKPVITRQGSNDFDVTVSTDNQEAWSGSLTIYYRVRTWYYPISLK